MRKQLALLGFMGTGKSTIGVRLAEETGLRFRDLDTAIEERAGMSIAEIFAREGEEGFRRREKATLLAIGAPGQVLATGGGVVLDPENVKTLRQVGVLVVLTASLPVILTRVRGGARPLLAGPDPEAMVRELIETRTPIYRAVADFALDTTDLDPAEAARAIARWYNSISELTTYPPLFTCKERGKKRG